MKHKVYQLSLVILIVFSGYLLIVRGAISWVQYSPNGFLSFVETISNATVSVEDIEIDQTWLGGHFVIHHLQYKDKDTQLKAEKVAFDVNFFAPWLPYLKYGSYFEASNVHIDQLPLVTSSSKNLDFQSLILAPQDWPIQKIWKSVKLSNIELSVKRDHQYKFRIKTFRSYIGLKFTFAGVSEFQVDHEESSSFQYLGDFSTNVWNLPSDGEVNFLATKPIILQSLYTLLPKVVSRKLPEGNLVGSLKLKILKNRLEDLQIAISAQDLTWLKNNPSLPQSLGFTLQLNSGVKNIYGKDSEWNFDLKKIHIDGNYLKNISSINLRVKNYNQFYLQAKQFDLVAIHPLFKVFVNAFNFQNIGNGLKELVIEDLKGHFNLKKLSLEQLSFRIPKLNLLQGDYFPGLRVANLSVRLTPQGFKAKAPTGLYITSRIFNEKAFHFQPLGALDLVFDSKMSQWILPKTKLMMGEVLIQAEGSLKKSGVLDLSLDLEAHNMAVVKRYLPYRLMGEDLSTWLNMALVGGERIKGKVRFTGKPADFPFNNREGVFEASADVEALNLKFQPDWPAITSPKASISFKPYGLTITSDKANLGGVVARDILVTIPNLDKNDIAVNIAGQAQADATEALTYLAKTPLLKYLGVEDFVADHVLATGDLNVNLNKIWIPINGYAGKEIEVAGDVALKGVDLTLYKLVKTEQLKGHIYFTEREVKTKRALQGLVESGHAAINLSSHKSVLIIKAAGLAKADNDIIAGKQKWQAVASLPLAGSGKIHITAQADLTHAISRLPSPLNNFKTLPNRLVALDFNLNGQKMDLAVTGFGKVYGLASGDRKDGYPTKLIISTSKPNVPKLQKGYYIDVALDRLDVDGWLALWTKSKSESFKQPATRWKPSKFSVREMTLLGRKFHNLDVHWREVKEQAKTVVALKLTSREVDLIATKSDSYAVNLTRLNIADLSDKHSEIQKGSLPNQPSKVQKTTQCNIPKEVMELPEIFFKGENIQVGKRFLSKLDFHLKDSNKQLMVKSFVMQLKAGKGKLTGTYFYNKKNQKSHLAAAIMSENIESVLAFIGVNKGLKGNKLKINSQVSWPGPMRCYSKFKLKGGINYSLKEGSIENADPGIARILSLLSFESLARRLQLKTSEVPESGMVFNKIEGNGNFSRGIFTIDKLELTAPSADANIFGKINLVKEKLNLYAEITPVIGSTLPALALLTGIATPIAGLAAYVFLKAIPSINEDLVTYRYEVKGSLQKPEIIDKGLKLDVIQGKTVEDKTDLIDQE